MSACEGKGVKEELLLALEKAGSVREKGASIQKCRVHVQCRERGPGFLENQRGSLPGWVGNPAHPRSAW